MYLMEMMAPECAVRSGLRYAGKCAMEDVGRVTGIRPSEIEKNVVHAIGAERLARSVVEGGDAGVDCSESRLSVRTGIMNCLHQQVRLLFRYRSNQLSIV